MYSTDILGGEFEQMTLQMKADYEGEVVSTLIRAKKPENKHCILYVHGFSDYFFQKEMAEYFINQGYNFYALDLRKCGRSLRPWQVLGNMRNINEYYEDIDAAIARIKNETQHNPILLGHSTGGLILSIYLNCRDKDTAEALILNSPFLEMNIKKSLKKLLPFISFISCFFPNKKINKGLSLNYGYSIAKRMYGEWEFNEKWKPLAVSCVYFSWLGAIHRAHLQVHNGLDIACPILVLRSDKSIKSKTWSDGFKTADAVLNVDDILKYSCFLGKKVTGITIQNGMHDLILSASDVRKKVYETMSDFLKINIPVDSKNV